MNTSTAPSPQESDSAAFAFVQELALELSAGKIDLPCFPDIALRVRHVLADDDVSVEKVVRVVGSEPTLAARLLQVANSAALNTSGRPVTDLRSAVARLGFNMVRSSVIAFAMSQLKKSETLKGLEAALDQLWLRSAEVAATSHVVARRLARVNPDTALLAGLLHGVGQLYILTRANRHEDLFQDKTGYNTIVRDWHSDIAKAVLENWDMSPEVVQAVGEFEILDRQHEGPADLCDVLTVANLLVSFRDHPDMLELNMQGVSACKRMRLERATLEHLVRESADDIGSLKAALGV